MKLRFQIDGLKCEQTEVNGATIELEYEVAEIMEILATYRDLIPQVLDRVIPLLSTKE